jgi:hypothetical protein
VIKQIRTDDTGSDYAIIKWETNEKTRATINYGKTVNYDNSLSSDPSYLRNGKFVLRNLNAGITYHFSITFTDPSANTSTSNDKIFTTLLDGSKVLGAEFNTVDASVLAPPQMRSLEIKQESAVKAVDLNWSESTTGDAEGYIIYRRQQLQGVEAGRRNYNGYNR